MLERRTTSGEMEMEKETETETRVRVTAVVVSLTTLKSQPRLVYHADMVTQLSPLMFRFKIKHYCVPTSRNSRRIYLSLRGAISWTEQPDSTTLPSK